MTVQILFLKNVDTEMQWDIIMTFMVDKSLRQKATSVDSRLLWPLAIADGFFYPGPGVSNNLKEGQIRKSCCKC